MSHRRSPRPSSAAVFALAALLAACGEDRATGSGAAEPPVEARYAVANSCVALRARPPEGLFVLRTAEGRYEASATTPAAAERFFLKPTALGKYLLYGTGADFLGAQADTARSAAQPGEATEWTLDGDATLGFTLFSADADRFLSVSADATGLVLADAASAGERARFSLEAATGCARFPEIEVNISGEPFKGNGADRPALGFVDSHAHLTATDFLGGAHHGRPFHRFGVTEALGNCAAQHGPGGTLDLVGNTYVYGNPARPHATDGWPTFSEWPNHVSLTHEQMYYKWVERAWRSGLRIMVNFLVQNETLCLLQRLVSGQPAQNCNEMDAARLQAQQIRDLQDYIDAQEGGPGRGWFRIVTSPAEARSVIDDGKLAVILGIEVSHLFDCGVQGGVPQCDLGTIDRELDEFYALGVRTVFPVHEFDNAFGGNGIFNSLFLNIGNFFDTGRFWDTYACPDQPYYYDAGSYLVGAPLPDNPLTDALFDLTGGLFNGNLVPAYDPRYRHCNARSITDLGRDLIERLMAKKVMIEIDHMELAMKGQVLELAQAQDPPYPVMSSHGGHGGISLQQAQLIYEVGGLIFPYRNNGIDFVAEWRKAKAIRDPSFTFGAGFGADTNGLGSQPPPRGALATAAVNYPFTLFRGPGWGPQFDRVAPLTVDRQRSGERVFDTDVDGGAHYGMTADWVEEVRIEGGEEAISDLYGSAEAYLQMWERVVDR